jgi:hypothetical protein
MTEEKKSFFDGVFLLDIKHLFFYDKNKITTVIVGIRRPTGRSKEWREAASQPAAVAVLECRVVIARRLAPPSVIARRPQGRRSR